MHMHSGTDPFFTDLPSFIFRKLMHTVAFSSVTVVILKADNWQGAALTFLLGFVSVWPVLSVLEQMPWYDNLVTQKTPGELKKSLTFFFAMLTLLVTVLWGILNRPLLAAASILMWGTGDAAAALVGIPFGKHKIPGRLSDGKKSWEGSLAMFLTAWICGYIVLRTGNQAAYLSAISSNVMGRGAAFHPVFCSALGALVGTVAEFLTPGGLDTVTVPGSIAVILALMY